MRIDIIGGGPASLYFAILAQKSFPAASIEVVERNAADDTFGFGIVLSDETLANLKAADEPSYREIADGYERVTWPSQYLLGARQLHALWQRAREEEAKREVSAKPPAP